MRGLEAAALALAVIVAPFVVMADDPDTHREVEALRREVNELREEVRALRDALKQQAVTARSTPVSSEQEQQLEAEIRAAMPGVTPTLAAEYAVAAAAPAGGAKSSSILNPDISLNVDFTFLGTDNNQLEKANRFSLREAEIGLQAPIDPFARADAFFTFPENETPEVEEAYATFLTLPFNLQARAGKFRLSFGKNNQLHLHALPQTDRPFAEVVNFGPDGLAGTGVEVSYLVRNPWDQYLLLTGEAVNELDEGSAGSQGTPDDQPQSSRVFRDFAYLGHAQTFFDFNPDHNLELGGSALFNLPGSGTQTRIYGVDLTYRWRPLRQAGYRQLIWRSEGYFTDLNVRGQPTPSANGTFNTAGFYTYGEYRLAQRWWLGTRVDWTELPALRHDTEWGIFPYTTFSPTEFGYFRLGYQYAVQDQLQNRQSNRVWLQYNFSIGPHAAHAF